MFLLLLLMCLPNAPSYYYYLIIQLMLLPKCSSLVLLSTYLYICIHTYLYTYVFMYVYTHTLFKLHSPLHASGFDVKNNISVAVLPCSSGVETGCRNSII